MTCNVDPDLQSTNEIQDIIAPQENDDELQDDEFLKKYFQERIEEMKQQIIQKYNFRFN
jgi:hypothetical protein